MRWSVAQALRAERGSRAAQDLKGCEASFWVKETWPTIREKGFDKNFGVIFETEKRHYLVWHQNEDDSLVRAGICL